MKPFNFLAAWDSALQRCMLISSFSKNGDDDEIFTSDFPRNFYMAYGIARDTEIRIVKECVRTGATGARTCRFFALAEF